MTRATEFRRVRERGRSGGGRHLVLGVWRVGGDNDGGSQAGGARVGFVTSRRVGGAVTRNAVRRRLREIVRQARARLRDGCWIVLVARHSAARASRAEPSADWLQLSRRAGILTDPAP